MEALRYFSIPTLYFFLLYPATGILSNAVACCSGTVHSRGNAASQGVDPGPESFSAAAQPCENKSPQHYASQKPAETTGNQ